MTIRSKPPTKEYDAGWDRTFGAKSERAKRDRALARKIKQSMERQVPVLIPRPKLYG